MSEIKEKLASCSDILQAANLEPKENFEIVNYGSIDTIEPTNYEGRMLSALAFLLSNSKDSINKVSAQDLMDKIDNVICSQVQEVLQDDTFRKLEESWRSIYELASSIDNNKTKLAILDVDKEELAEDFEMNAADILSSDLFQKTYVHEYDQYGGEPFGSIIGLYEFDKTQEDIEWLMTMGKIAEASHAPFIAAISPNFFGGEDYNSLSEIKDIDSMMAHPRFGRWNAFRKTKSAGYIGLTLPNFMLRAPYHPDTNPVGKGVISNFKESVDISKPYESCLWGNAAVLFAKNLYRSFTVTGWCQSICGPTSGGLVEGLPIYNYNSHDANAYVLPTNYLIPDHKEYGLAKAGFIPLVYEKKTANACFFSAQSLKLAEEFENDNDSENSQMVTKLPYTFSMSKIAHYVKCMTRDVIGSEADETVVKNSITSWLNQYVTTAPNPNSLTKSYYPFKKVDVGVERNRGMAGHYKCHIEVLPHIKFEGMEVTMKIDTRLDS
ncbi:type VI secretion system contractile sheath large subunit [Allofrancisella frigidaquae]|uniref:Type VI secretion system contractile sheath large subunit n=1 Tax=Allofrancisella frigidaquae TaxID=1085644 RepID=A0A6M3HSM0_9GAMM|nr:type VI secretion system contractile sheath large subunit [Allofrancisella frigidaquae]KEI34743.1 uncharacterized protein ImpC [Francisella sp. W12-1067]QIV94145.1 type VI secretion system contractile sheath large subunit [Allofrancisella frigidaquae]